MSESRALDRESRRLIREELLTNILVEAGAGSGKTQMLAERMAAGIAKGVYRVEHLAAVTFTRKAASELRGRFHLALEAELSTASDPQRAGRVQDALANLERFFAGTIHSFCARLLRERPVESGVSPCFTELDEVQDLELRQRAWRDFITSARSAGDAEMMALLEAGVRPQDLDFAFSIVAANDDVEFPPGEAKCPDPRPARQALEAFWQELKKHVPAPIDGDTTCKIQQAALKFEREWALSRGRADRPGVMASLLATWKCESKITLYQWSSSKPEQQRLKSIVNQLHADFVGGIVAPFLSEWRGYVYRLAVTLLTRAREAAAAERRRLNTLNYGDLLTLSARVLRENETVRRALQDKFKYLLVDEFQDTDPVQAEIVFWLAEDGAASRPSKAAAAPDWRTVPLRPGALFVVGDPKQSIYRFRRADIDIYNIVRGRFSDPAIGRVMPLTQNFRSIAPLCSWANEVFATRFPAVPTTHASRFAALDPREGDGAAGGVFTLTHASDGSLLLQQDADRIATYIRSEVDAGRRQYSDFLILTRKKRGRIGPYADALEALNIPVEVSGAGAFGESAEVHALAVLLRALSDPQDALSLVAVLRGPLFGISDPELFDFKQNGGWFSLFQQPKEGGATAEAPPVEQAVAALRSYYRWTRVLPAGAALDRILEDTGYLALAATTPGGVEAGDVLHALDRIRQVVEDGGSLADAADALEADIDSTNEVESLPLEPGRSNVVRLMNLHKAKGLEATVVFLADPAGGMRPRVDVHIARTDLKPKGWLKIVKQSDTSWATTLLGEHTDWRTHEAAELPYLQAEEDRLLYVAATRAREMLVVSRSTERQRTPLAWGALNDFLARATELTVPATATAPHTAPLACATATLVADAKRQGDAHDRFRQPSWAIASVTAEARHIAHVTRSVDAAPDDPSKVVTTDTRSHRADAGQAWGTLIHGLLEHAMRQKTANAGDLRRLGMWLTVEEPHLRQVLDLAVDTVLQVWGAEFWDEAKKSAAVSVETPFAFASEPAALLNGVIDLLFVQENGWRIVDYKTDLDDPDGASSYEHQLKMYERALRAVGVQHVMSKIQPVRKIDDTSA